MWSWQLVGTELAALGAVAASWPLRFVSRHERWDPSSPHRTPAVLVHGFLGDASNLLVLRTALAAHGVRNFATFSYGPRLDHDRLADDLVARIDAIRAATGVPEVDVIGHSLGGLVGRQVVDARGGGRIRRLVSLGAPYFARPLPPNELAIFAAHDPFIPTPHIALAPSRIVVVPDCGHWGLLYHPETLDHVARFLTADAPRAKAASVRRLRLPMTRRNVAAG